MKTLFTALVGSRAHGLAREDSDYDYRSVYQADTQAFLSLWPPTDVSSSSPIGDHVRWEVGHFLRLALKCNPTILETLASPFVTTIDQSMGEGTRSVLFDKVWSTDAVKAAFGGYGNSLLHRVEESKRGDRKELKDTLAAIRVFFQGAILLSEGVLPVDLRKLSVYYDLMYLLQEQVPTDERIKLIKYYRQGFDAERNSKNRAADPEFVNNWLIKLRESGYLQ